MNWWNRFFIRPIEVKLNESNWYWKDLSSEVDLRFVKIDDWLKTNLEEGSWKYKTPLIMGHKNQKGGWHQAQNQ